MKKLRQIIVWAGLGLVVGLFLGNLHDFPPGIHNYLSGDVAQAKRFKKEVTQSQNRLLLEKLQADTLLRDQTRSALSLVSARNGEFFDLLQSSCEVCRQLEDFQDLVARMEALLPLARNAAQHGTTAQGALALALAGADLDVEAAYNRALLSYTLLDKQSALAHDYVEAVDKYLQGKNPADHAPLALTRDRWATYGLFEAFLHADKPALEAWGKEGNLLANKEMINYNQAMFNTETLGQTTPKNPGITPIYSQFILGNMVEAFMNGAQSLPSDVLQAAEDYTLAQMDVAGLLGNDALMVFTKSLNMVRPPEYKPVLAMPSQDLGHSIVLIIQDSFMQSMGAFPRFMDPVGTLGTWIGYVSPH